VLRDHAALCPPQPQLLQPVHEWLAHRPRHLDARVAPPSALFVSYVA
jgi:hypothetical protein